MIEIGHNLQHAIEWVATFASMAYMAQAIFSFLGGLK